MSVETHIEALRAKHAELEAAIAAENQRPLPDSTVLTELKRQKLRIKEEIERLHVDM